jgi:hypothetical protein
VTHRNGFPYSEELVSLVIETHLPTKWLFVDQETGDVWQWNPNKNGTGGWSRAHEEVCAAIRSSLQR